MNRTNSNQLNYLLDKFSNKKMKAFAKLNQALTIDESECSCDDKVTCYSDALLIIENAIQYFNDNQTILIEDECALVIIKQLNDIKTKTKTRIYDIKQVANSLKINEANKSTLEYLTSCLNAPEKSPINRSRKKIDKSQISGPTEFRLIQHIGFTTDYKFEINLKLEDDQSKKMKILLKELNVPYKMNKKTEAFVNNYINEHGGLNRFSESLKKKEEPARVLSFKNKNHFSNNSLSTSDRYLTPNFKQIQNSLSQPEIDNSAPLSIPPPPPPTTLPPPIIQQNYSEVKSDMDYSIISGNTPPFPPPPPPLPPRSLNSNINRSNSSINLSSNDSRQNLMDSIKGFSGFHNKQQKTNRNSDASSQQLDSSIIDQLKNELLKRAPFLNDSSDGEDDDANNSEW